MKRILLFLLAASLSVAALGQSVAKGYVYEDLNGNGRKDRREKGIRGVAVSDGENIVTTDENGRYELPVKDHCVIFVIKPRGYISPVNDDFQTKSYYIHKPDGSPAYSHEASSPTGPLPESLDFPMRPYDDPENFKFFAFGDPQPYSLREVGFFSKAIVEEAKNYDGVSFGISLGDIAGERPDLYRPYLEAMRGMGIPWYNVLGNHDRNYDATEDRLSNETFEATFGPTTHAFRFGNAHFILLDDILMSDPPKGKPYVGGLREDQFTFVENYLKLVNKGELVILSYHIPIAFKKDQFLDSHRRRLFKILEGHNVLALSAHSHIQMQFLLGENLGWTGERPFHEYNVGTTNGDWYSGKLNDRGLPDATMRDGTPQGYAIVTVENDKYIFDYKVAGKPSDCQMTVYAPEVIPYKQGGKYPVYVNFYIGENSDVVKFRVDKGEWKKMVRTEEPDPTFMNLVYEWDRAGHALPGRRSNSVPAVTTHLWKATLDNTLEPGEHVIEIKAKDMFGRTYTASKTYRTEKYAD